MDISGIGSSGGGFSGMNVGGMRRPDPSEFAGRLAGHMVDEQDVDGDGSLSLEETELSEEAFGAIDGDGDGFITTAEIQNGIMDKAEQFRQQHMGENGMALQQGEGMQRPQGPPPGGRGLEAYKGQMSSLMSSVFEEDGEGFGALVPDAGSLSVSA